MNTQDYTLRSQLSILAKASSSNDHELYNLVAEELKNINEKFNKKITIVHTSLSLDKFSCFEYALGLHDFSDYMQAKERLTQDGFGNVFCNSFFVKWLKYDLNINDSGPLVLYEERVLDGIVLHAGVLKDNGRIVSKWGSTCLFEHGYLEVPLEYGDNIKLYQKPDAQQVFAMFKNYIGFLSNSIQTVLNKK